MNGTLDCRLGMKLPFAHTPNIEKGRLSKRLSNKFKASANRGGQSSLLLPGWLGPVEIAVLDGLGNVVGCDLGLSGQIGNRAGDFKNPVEGPGAEPQLIDGLF